MGQRDGTLGKRRDAAERMGEGRVGQEEAPESALLHLWAAAGEGRDDAGDFLDCGCLIMITGSKRDFRTWVLHYESRLNVRDVGAWRYSWELGVVCLPEQPFG